MSGYETLMTDVGNLAMLPGKWLMHWPAFIIFAVVDYAYDVIIEMVPRLGGTTGSIERSVLMGATKTLDFIVWDSVTKRA